MHVQSCTTKTQLNNYRQKLQNVIFREGTCQIAINEEFNELSKYDLKTELSFGYKTDSEIKIGRVDLLVIQKERIIIIDYKSGKSNKGLIPDTYIKQLRFYKQAFREIYPDKIIDCKIIWLDSGTIVNVAA